MAAHVLQVLGLEEHHRPVGADQGEGGGAGAEVGPVAEEVELDDRLANPVLDRPEERQRSDPERGQGDHRAVAPGARLDQRQDDRGEADAERRQPGQSILVPAPGSVDSGAARAVMKTPSAATGRLSQKITRQSISIRMPPTSGPIASATAETAAQIPSARGRSAAGKTLTTSASESARQGRGTGTLQDPAEDQHIGVAGGPGDDRAERKADQAEEEDALAAEHVAEPAGGDDEHRDRQQVDVHHPLQLLGAGADVAADLGQREGDDGRVEHQDEEAGAGADEGPPFAFHAATLRLGTEGWPRRVAGVPPENAPPSAPLECFQEAPRHPSPHRAPASAGDGTPPFL